MLSVNGIVERSGVETDMYIVSLALAFNYHK